MSDPGDAIPDQVTIEHRQKLALTYARQSSPGQVVRHFGSTIVQRGLADIPRAWKWPDSLIRVMDEDLGLSGRSSAGRTDLVETLDLIDQNLVGMLVLQDSSRWSRRPLEGELILQRCIAHRVLIHIGGRLFDPANAELHELLNLRVQNLLAWLDNENRLRNQTAAKVAKTRHRHAVTRPPRGYVISVRGQWVKDELPVREAIDRAFELYPQLGSIRKVVAHFHAQGWLFPVRRQGLLEWSPVTNMQVAHLLRNPLYSGRLVYRRMKVHEKTESAPRRVDRLPESEWVFAEDDAHNPVIHHEPYINWDAFVKNQAMLSNQRVRKHPPILNGPAVLQGLLWCATCARTIRTVYQMKVKGRRLPSYVCRPADRYGHRRRCFSVPSALLDTIICREVLSFLPQVDAESVRMLIRNAHEDVAATDRTRAHHLARYEAEVAQARRRYHNIQDPAHRLVKLELEKELEAAKARFQDYEREMARAPRPTPPLFHPDVADELANRFRSSKEIWDAPTTTNEDRKCLLGMVISKITVLKSSPKEITLEVLWAGGQTDLYPIPRPPGVREMVDELRHDHRPTEIVRILRARGVLSRYGTLVTFNVVWRNLRLLRQQRPATAMKGGPGDQNPGADGGADPG